MELEMKKINDKFGIYFENKLLFVFNRAFNCDLIRLIMEADEEYEIIKLDEILPTNCGGLQCK